MERETRKDLRVAILLSVGLALLATCAWGQAPKATDFGGVAAVRPTGDDVMPPVAPKGGAEAIAPTGIHVLLVQADDSPSPLISGLLSYPDIAGVAIFDARTAIPTLAQLQAYDVAIVWSNYVYYNSTAIGDVLADYVDAGGKVITAPFSWAVGWAMGGRYITGGYSPFTGLGLSNHYSTSCLGTYDAAHPIMAGVTSACDYYRDQTGLTSGATLVASYEDGENFVATKACSVAINSYPGVDYAFTGDMVVIFHNAVTFLYYGGCVANPYDLSFLDDLRRSQVCVSSTTGAWQYTVLSGAGMGTYTGTGTATGAAVMNPLQIVSSPSSPYRFTLTYWAPRGTASATLRSGGFNSTLSDRNTKDDPPCGGTQPN